MTSFFFCPLLGGTPPGPPTNVALEIIDSTSVRLTWEPPTTDGDTVTAYVVTYTDSTVITVKVNADETNVTITDLESDRTYTFTIAAENVNGLSSEVTRSRPPTTEGESQS